MSQNYSLKGMDIEGRWMREGANKPWDRSVMCWHKKEKLHVKVRDLESRFHSMVEIEWSELYPDKTCVRLKATRPGPDDDWDVEVTAPEDVWKVKATVGELSHRFPLPVAGRVSCEGGVVHAITGRMELDDILALVAETRRRVMNR